MRKAVETLGFQYAAIDYCDLPDGNVLLWEANPYFLMAPANERVCGRKRNLGGHYDVIGDALIGFFRGLLDGASIKEAQRA